MVQYMQATSWEHKQVAKWISVLDPPVYEELRARYQELGSEGLKHLYQGSDACHSGLVMLANVAVDPHKDRNDARDSWTSTNCWFDFKGGFVGFPEIGIKIAQEAGDLILSHAAVLTHFVEDVEDGERYCHVRFTKKDILRPQVQPLKLNIRCPFAECATICPSESSMKRHLRGPTGRKRLKARQTLYHFLESEEARAKLEQAMRASKGSDSNAAKRSST